MWSPKGGSGLSTIAVGVAALSARQRPTVLVDLAGDQPALCGLAADPDVGVHDWLDGRSVPPSGALQRLGHSVAPGLTLLPSGDAAASVPRPDSGAELVRTLASLAEAVVVDAGLPGSEPARALVEGADHSILVTRACYLSLRRAVARPELVTAATAAVVLVEEHRSLGEGDVARVLGLPILATIAADRDVARAVDAGTLVTRPPRRLARAMSSVSALFAAPPVTDLGAT